jgi:hypothetical protein
MHTVDAADYLPSHPGNDAGPKRSEASWLRDEEVSRVALFWPYKGAHQRQTTNDAEYVFAGKPTCALVLAERFLRIRW